MSAVPLAHALGVCAALFALGLAGLLVRRGLLFSLMCLEIMLNAAGLAFVVGGSRPASSSIDPSSTASRYGPNSSMPTALGPISTPAVGASSVHSRPSNCISSAAASRPGPIQ